MWLTGKGEAGSSARNKAFVQKIESNKWCLGSVVSLHASMIVSFFKLQHGASIMPDVGLLVFSWKKNILSMALSNSFNFVTEYTKQA